MSWFDALLPSSDQAAAQNASGGQQLASRLRDMIAAEGSLSKLNGDLAALPMPGGSGSAIRAVLSSGNALVDSMDAFSGVFQTAVDDNSYTTAEEVAAVKDGDVVLVRGLAWEKAIGALGLRQCPFWTAHPPRVAPTMASPTAPATPPPATSPAPPAASLTAGELQLTGHLNADDLTNCVGRQDQETGTVIAAINCQSVQSGPTENPLVVQFPNAAAAQTWFASNTVGFVNGNDCAGGHELGSWDHDGLFAGPWGCTYVSSGGLRIVWVDDASLVGFIADGSDGPALYSWWTNWGDPLTSGG